MSVPSQILSEAAFSIPKITARQIEKPAPTLRVRKCEIPRKTLHIAVGVFFTYLYLHGSFPPDISKWALEAVVTFTAIDALRHRFPAIEKAFHKIFGALMRTEEAHTYHSMIWYLGGSYITLRFFPEDVAITSILILTFSDTAAATFGRWCTGPRTVYPRRGKSLPGTLAAALVGALAAAIFWGYFVVYAPEGRESFMFQGRLVFCPDVRGWTRGCTGTMSRFTITGPMALAVLSVISGFIAGGGFELVDVCGMDDNLTVPILSALGLVGFLAGFGLHG